MYKIKCLGNRKITMQCTYTPRKSLFNLHVILFYYSYKINQTRQFK